MAKTSEASKTKTMTITESTTQVSSCLLAIRSYDISYLDNNRTGPS